MPATVQPEAVKGKMEELGYLTVPRSLPDPATAPKIEWARAETFKEKAWRKTRENPFVPIGLGVTVFALTYGVYQMKTGDRIMSQKMMRLRVGAQGFTIVALLAGVLYNSRKESAKRAALAAGLSKPE